MTDDLSNGLKWEITKEEEKNTKTKKFKLLLKLLPFVGLLFFLDPVSRQGTMIEQISSVANLILFIAILIFIWYIFSMIDNAKRIYSLGSKGLILSKGNKTKFYSWDDFECYYPYSFIRNGDNDKIEHNINVREETREKITETVQQFDKIDGRTFYLKKKPVNILQKLAKIFVVVSSEQDNSAEVDKFLNTHLPKKEMTSTTDLGLVLYEFK